VRPQGIELPAAGENNPPAAPPASVVIVEGGDTILTVGSNDYTVDAHTLDLHFPQWTEQRCWSCINGRPGIGQLQLCEKHKHKLCVPDGIDHAILLVLRVMHHANSDVPHIITFRELVDIAEVCEMYHVHNVLIPWLGLWMPRLEKLALHPGFEDWFLVAWTFRVPLVFKSLSRVLIYEGLQAPPGLPWWIPGNSTFMVSRWISAKVVGLCPPPPFFTLCGDGC
jgi:hypothetical protein